MRTLQPNIPYEVVAVVADFSTPHFVTEHCTWQAYQLKIDGDLIGVFKLQTTHHPEDVNSWTDVTGSSQAMNAAVNPYHTTENFDACAPFYRAYFEYISGTGDATVSMFAKGTT